MFLSGLILLRLLQLYHSARIIVFKHVLQIQFLKRRTIFKAFADSVYMSPSFTGMSYPACEGVFIKEIILKIKFFSSRSSPNLT